MTTLTLGQFAALVRETRARAMYGDDENTRKQLAEALAAAGIEVEKTPEEELAELKAAVRRFVTVGRARMPSQGALEAFDQLVKDLLPEAARYDG